MTISHLDPSFYPSGFFANEHLKHTAKFFFRGQKDFICREFSCRKEKRKTAYWGMQGDPETSEPQHTADLKRPVKKQDVLNNLLLIFQNENICFLIKADEFALLES
jgi:hypothetical protein